MLETVSGSEAGISGVHAGRVVRGTRSALQPVLALLMGLGFLEMAFWAAPQFEAMYEDLGQKVLPRTVFALQAASVGRSIWGVSIVVGFVASSSWLFWRTRRRSLEKVMLGLAALAAFCAFACIWVLVLSLSGGIIKSIK